MRYFAAFVMLSLGLAGPAAAESYGEPRPAALAPVGVEAALDAGNTTDTPLAVEGRITQVCQAKGCWVVLAEDDAMIRVMARDHDFFLPRDASGRAVAHGTLERVELSPEHAEHMVAEDGADPALRDHPVEIRLVADGVELVDS